MRRAGEKRAAPAIIVLSITYRLLPPCWLIVAQALVRCAGQVARLDQRPWTGVRPGVTVLTNNAEHAAARTPRRSQRCAIARLRATRRRVPLSRAALPPSETGFHGGMPLHWMADWPMPFLPVVREAAGARLTDIDGITLDDFCLGDTGSMFGHSPEPVPAPSRHRPRAA